MFFDIIPKNILVDLFCGQKRKHRKAMIRLCIHHLGTFGLCQQFIIDRYGNRRAINLEAGQVLINVSEIKRMVSAGPGKGISRDAVRKEVREMEFEGVLKKVRKIQGQDLWIYQVRHPNLKNHATQGRLPAAGLNPEIFGDIGLDDANSELSNLPPEDFISCQHLERNYIVVKEEVTKEEVSGHSDGKSELDLKEREEAIKKYSKVWHRCSPDKRDHLMQLFQFTEEDLIVDS